MSRSVLISGVAGVVLAVLVAVLSTGGMRPSGSEAGGVGCTQSFAAWQGLAGHWEGTWVNHMFSSNGTLTADVTINAACTAEAVIDGIFMQPGPQTVNATYRDENGTTIEVQNDPIFGDATINIAADGTLTLNGSGMHQSIEGVTGTGDVSTTEINVDIHMTFTGGGTADETIHLTRGATATPTATPTTEPTPTPTGAPGLVQGNVDCNASVNSVDSLKVLRFVAQLSVSQEPGCPLIGAEIASFWGDVDCSDAVNSVDALKILRFVAELSVTQTEPCADIGTPFDH